MGKEIVMSDPKPKLPHVRFFSKAIEARQVLSDRAVDIIEAYLALASEARAAGDFEVAADILWKLIDHMPRVESVGIIDSPASQPVEDSGSKGPQISIGVQLGGMTRLPITLEAQNPIEAEIIKVE